MKGSDVFPSKSLKAEDLKGIEPVVVIEKITTQTFDDKSIKPVIHFAGKEKTLVCNKTNWNAIVEITGQSDSDHWIGQRIKLVTALVDFQGKRVPAIRVEAPGRNGPRPAPPRTPPPVEPINDDDIPFSWVLPMTSLLPLGWLLV